MMIMGRVNYCYCKSKGDETIFYPWGVRWESRGRMRTDRRECIVWEICGKLHLYSQTCGLILQTPASSLILDATPKPFDQSPGITVPFLTPNKNEL